MAELKYYVESPVGNVYGPMTAGDRGNHVARGYKDVTDQHTAEKKAEPEPERPSARPAPSQRRSAEQPQQSQTEQGQAQQPS